MPHNRSTKNWAMAQSIDEQLILAAYQRCIYCLNRCLVNGANLETKDKYCGSPLLIAILCKSIKCVTFLLNAGANVATLDHNGQPTMHNALRPRGTILYLIYNGWTKSCDYCSFNFKINLVNNPNNVYDDDDDDFEVDAAGVTLPNRALAPPISDDDQSLQIIKLLVFAGADFNGRDKYGHTPLHKALVHGFRNVAKYLVDIGAEMQDDYLNMQPPIPYVITLTPKHAELFRAIWQINDDDKAANVKQLYSNYATTKKRCREIDAATAAATSSAVAIVSPAAVEAASALASTKRTEVFFKIIPAPQSTEATATTAKKFPPITIYGGTYTSAETVDLYKITAANNYETYQYARKTNKKDDE